ncbi:hypothetical protein MSPP1_001163 [Malassezia sp. CBS 17886]|nr:hypothetical protein MSPP1_001163 [Malassezia sp. CBS 17886]
MSAARPPLVQTLRAAASAGDAAALQEANAQLDAWETQPGYFEALLDVALDRTGTCTDGASADETNVNTRRLAAIRFKHGTAKFWRGRIVERRSVQIDAHTKERLRTALLAVLHEPDRVVSAQIAVAIARIARLDYPGAWPRLVPLLEEALVSAFGALHACATSAAPPDASAVVVLLRAGDVLRQCVKEFASVRVLAGKMRLSELARTLIPALLPVYEQLAADALPGAADAATLSAWASALGRAEVVRACHLLFKVLARLALADSGMVAARVAQGAGDRQNHAHAFFACTPRTMAQLAQLRVCMGDACAHGDVRAEALAAVLHPLTKYMVAHAKFHRALVTQANSHAAAWPGWAELVAWYWVQVREAPAAGLPARPEAAFDEHTHALYPYRWLVLALVVVRMSLMAWRHERPAASAFVGAAGAQFELDAVDVLLDAYLRLAPADLARWSASPEEFAVYEEQADPDVDLRPAAERLVMVLSQWSVRRARDGEHAHVVPSVAEHIWARFEKCAALDASMDGVLARDATYVAAGRCRDQLAALDAGCSDVDAGAACGDRLAGAILPLVAAADQRGGAWTIVRRRTAWLLWEWSEHVAVDARPRVYALLVQLLTPGAADAAVHLAAVRSLTAIVDTVEFDADAFAPFLSDALTALTTLVADWTLSEIDSIRTVATALSVLIERVGPRTVPHMARLLDMVPALWMQDDADARARPSILEFLIKLAAAAAPHLGTDDAALEQLHGTVAHVVRASLAPPLAPLLGYDALLLWVRTLQAAPRMTAPLFALLDTAPAHVLQPDYTALVCRAWEESALLAPLAVLESHARPMYAALAMLLGDSDAPSVLSPLAALDAHVRAVAAHAADAAPHAFLADVLHHADLFPALVSTLLRGEDMVYLAVAFVCVLCRLAVVLPHALFHELVRVCAVGRSTSPSGPPWGALIGAVVARVDNMPSMRKKKLAALGVASILRGAAADDVGIFTCVPEMIGMWTEVLGEAVEDSSGRYARPATRLTRSSQLLVWEAPERDPVDELDDQLGRSALGDGWEELEDVSPSGKRSAALLEEDPVTCVPLRPYISEALNDAISANPASSPGGAALQAALARMDPLVLDVFRNDLAEKPAGECDGSEERGASGA